MKTICGWQTNSDGRLGMKATVYNAATATPQKPHQHETKLGELFKANVHNSMLHENRLFRPETESFAK